MVSGIQAAWIHPESGATLALPPDPKAGLERKTEESGEEQGVRVADLGEEPCGLSAPTCVHQAFFGNWELTIGDV